MDIGGKTQLYGIFGYPVGHSLSPRLHNAVFQKKKIEAVYVPFEVNPDYLPEAIESLRSLGIRGINVTVPHKEAAANLIDEIPNDLDRAIGAINTILVKNGLLQGFNTDGPGFIEDLKEEFNFLPKGQSALILGAGGAARAIAFYLLKEGCGQLFIYNRTPERAEGLAEYLMGFFPKSRVKAVLSIEELAGERLNLLVNTTSCGMKAEDPFPVNPDILSTTQLVYDVIYAPAETKLIAEAKRRKVRASNGLGMLLRQACLAETIWFPQFSRHELYAIMKEAAHSCGM